jgi:uncharacterized membrane protein
MKAACFGLKVHHQAIKCMELFRNLQELINLYKVLSNRLALNYIYIEYFSYVQLFVKTFISLPEQGSHLFASFKYCTV